MNKNIIPCHILVRLSTERNENPRQEASVNDLKFAMKGECPEVFQSVIDIVVSMLITH